MYLIAFNYLKSINLKTIFVFSYSLFVISLKFLPFKWANTINCYNYYNYYLLLKLLLSKNGSNKFKIQSLYLFCWTFCIKMLKKNSTYYLKMNSSNTKNKIGKMLNIIFKYACIGPHYYAATRIESKSLGTKKNACFHKNWIFCTLSNVLI